jgi:tetratricopeptide (TPR) repeat protein
MVVRYEGAGAGPKLAVLALLAVFGGLVYVFWDRIKTRLAEDDITPVETAPAEEPVVSRPAPQPNERKVESRPVTKPATVVARPTEASAQDVREAAEFRRKAETAMELLDFATAAELYAKAASVLRLDVAGAKQAQDLATKAETFKALLGPVKRNPETEGNLVILRRHDQREMEVALVDETDDCYIVAKRGNIRGEIPKSDIKEMVKVPQETHRARAREAFRQEEAKIVGDSGIGHYLLAERAYRDGLDPEALKHLDAAYVKDGAGLPRALRRYQASQMLLRAMWCESTGRTSLASMWCQRLKREYADQDELVKDADELLQRMTATAVATYKPTVTIKVQETKSAETATASPQSANEKVTGVEVSSVTSRSARNKDHINQINKMFKDGMDHYVAGRPGSPDSNKHLGQAVSLFDKVIDLCEQALRNDPNNAEISSRQADAAKYGYHARKMKTLSIRG